MPFNKKKKEYFVGNKVWVTDQTFVWLPATISKVISTSNYQIYFNDDMTNSKIVNYKDIHSQISSEYDKKELKNHQVIRNLTKLSPLSAPMLLHAISKAYLSEIFYLGLGPGTVLALNPFKEVDGLFIRSVTNKYHEATLNQLSDLHPHIFLVAERALRHSNMVQPPSNQSIIISGESGAGKTWTVCSLMKYFTEVCNDDVIADLTSSIRFKILSSNPVLEAFGNAKTRRNHNSSRFGKYIKLQYNRFGNIIGASLSVYLLEKTRAAHYDPLECSFHIFYQLLNGTTSEERQLYQLPDHCDFISSKDRYKDHHPPSNPFHDWLHSNKDFRSQISNSISKGLNDENDFKTTKESMWSVGIKHHDQIFKILSSILHLKQISFEGPEEWKSGSQPVCKLSASCHGNVDKIISLLALPVKQFHESLTVRRIQAGKPMKRRRTIIRHACSYDECAVRRDVMVKLLYEKTFMFIVKQIAVGLSVDENKVSHFIGLLDVYGFECFETNSLEQLCINYANERLQQYYVINFLKIQKDELEQIGVKWKDLHLDGQKNCLENLESPQSSVFSFLHEECRLNRDDGVNHFHNRVSDQFAAGKYISVPRFTTDNLSFHVSHFAGKVAYSVEDIVLKNRDDVPAGILELLRSSEDPFVQNLIPSSVTSPKKGRAFESVVTRFKKSLDKLLAAMATTNCHYIRCIKPNNKSQPDHFESNYVIDQLRASGIIETARVCSHVTPHQVAINSFNNQFSFILPIETLVYDCVQMTSQQKTDSIIKHFTRDVITDLRNENWKIGTETLFLSSQLYEALINHRDDVINISSITIQRSWRRYQHRKHCRDVIRRLVRLRHRACDVIQRAWRQYVARKQASKIIQIWWRRLKKRHKAIVTLQRAWRRYQQRRHDDAISIIQSEESFVIVPHPIIVNKDLVFMTSPWLRLMRPFRFSMFSCSRVLPIIAHLGSLEEDLILETKWMLSYRKSSQLFDLTNILPFVDSIPRFQYA